MVKYQSCIQNPVKHSSFQPWGTPWIYNRQKVFCKKVSLEISQNSLEKPVPEAPFLIKLQAWGIQGTDYASEYRSNLLMFFSFKWWQISEADRVLFVDPDDISFPLTYRIFFWYRMLLVFLYLVWVVIQTWKYVFVETLWLNIRFKFIFG